MTQSLRQELVWTARELSIRGLTVGTSGNVSARSGAGLLVTPSAMRYSEMGPPDIVFLDADGVAKSQRKPTSEWRFHRDIYQARPELGAVIHVHSTFATTLACLGREIPAFHYMVAVAGGSDIRCAPYATFGTEELSTHVVRALDGRTACLMANHGLIATGKDLLAALDLTIEIENLAEQYWRCLAVGEPTILDDTEMRTVLEEFSNYRSPAPMS